MNGSAMLGYLSLASLRNLARSSQIIDEETGQNLSPKLVTDRAESRAQVFSAGTFHPKALAISLEIHKCHIKLGALAPRLCILMCRSQEIGHLKIACRFFFFFLAVNENFNITFFVAVSPFFCKTL